MSVRCAPIPAEADSLSIGIVGDMAGKIALREQECLDAGEQCAIAQVCLTQQAIMQLR